MDKWYFDSKIVLIFCEKKCCSDLEKLKDEGQEFAKFLRLLNTTTIFSHRRSEQFWKQNAFLTNSWKFLRSNKLPYSPEF